VKDIRVDGDGEFRCWNCGNKGLVAKRTFRSKLVFGVSSLLTKKKLKCQTCGEFNDTGNAKPFTGPEARKWRKVYEKQQAAKSQAQLATEQRAAELAAQAFVAEVHAAEAGATEAVDYSTTPAVATAPTASPSPDAVPPPPPPVVPAGWQPDPTGRFQVRYWDGSQWTPHVSTAGVQDTDPVM